MSGRYEDTADSLNELIDRLIVLGGKIDDCDTTVQNAASLNSDTQANVATIREALEVVQTTLNQV